MAILRRILMIHHLNLLTLPVCFVKASSSNHEYWLLVVFMKGHGHSWINTLSPGSWQAKTKTSSPAPWFAVFFETSTPTTSTHHSSAKTRATCHRCRCIDIDLLPGPLSSTAANCWHFDLDRAINCERCHRFCQRWGMPGCWLLLFVP